MTITTTTPQAELKQLSDAAIKREFLKGTPLNLGKFLRYVLLYLLFPGMVFGFAAGIVLTAVFCLALTGILIWGMNPMPPWPSTAGLRQGLWWWCLSTSSSSARDGGKASSARPTAPPRAG